MCSLNVRSLVPRSVIALGAVALVALSGCGGHYVSRGSDLYADGRYVEAAEVFERTEARLADSSSSERARFGLYRGATFLRLGDAMHAARWLGYARSVVTQDPDALGSSDAALLEASLKTLAQAKVPPVQKLQPELATAPADASQAPAP
jgi:thioredoxin-like negative regulator of GroEL